MGYESLPPAPPSRPPSRRNLDPLSLIWSSRSQQAESQKLGSPSPSESFAGSCDIARGLCGGSPHRATGYGATVSSSSPSHPVDEEQPPLPPRGACGNSRGRDDDDDDDERYLSLSDALVTAESGDEGSCRRGVSGTAPRVASSAAQIAGAGAWLCRGLRTGSYDATCGGDDDLRSSSSSRSKLIFDGSR